jgi:hypothetical protein
MMRTRERGRQDGPFRLRVAHRNARRSWSSGFMSNARICSVSTTTALLMMILTMYAFGWWFDVYSESTSGSDPSLLSIRSGHRRTDNGSMQPKQRPKLAINVHPRVVMRPFITEASNETASSSFTAARNEKRIYREANSVSHVKYRDRQQQRL